MTAKIGVDDYITATGATAADLNELPREDPGDGNPAGTVAEEPWEAPLPLPTAGAGPPFPVAVLPSGLRAFVEAVATALQVPPDLPALLTLSVVAAAVARKLAVRVRDGWVEPLNLYSVTVLPPGEGKSPAFMEATRPLEAWEAAEAQRMAPVIREAETRRAILEARAKHAKDVAAKAKADERAALEDEAQDAARELAACIVPVVPRLVADDVTPERLGSMLQEQGGRLAVMSAEGGVFELMAGRYSKNGAPNLDVFLKGHPGDTLRVDRGTRPADFVRKPALTVALAVQPDVLDRLHGIPEFRGRGLLARFLYALPASRVGTRDKDAPAVSSSVRSGYAARIRVLLDLPPPEEGEDGPAPGLVSLSADAWARFQAFRRGLEPELKPGATLANLADWANKLDGGVARLAGLLHVADLAEECPGALLNAVVSRAALAISGATMVRAITLADYVTAHARLAFRVMGEDPAFRGAKRVLAWLRGCPRASFRRRDCHRALAGTFPRVADLEPALALLVEYGYLRPHVAPARRDSATYLVNPKLSDTLDTLDTRPHPAGPEPVTVKTVKSVDGEPDVAPPLDGGWEEV